MENWRSPNVREKGGGSYSDPEKALARLSSGHQVNLEDQMLVASMWTTCRASDGEKGSTNQKFGAGGVPLPAQMGKASPRVTPSARDWKDSAGMATVAEDGRNRTDQLPRQMVAAYMPTPTVADVTGGRKHRSGSRSGELLLNGIMAQATWPTITIHGNYSQSGGQKGCSPSAGDGICTVMVETARSGQEQTGSSATTTKRAGSPTPMHPCWLMGLPLHWIAFAPSKIERRRR
jgi:hypothetical protein